MSETRIALIMGGGVSLGSFSGGAVAQVIRLLKDVERGPAKIDVLSGASAGSMTLGVVACHLFRGSTGDDIEKALYRAWVKRIGLENLINDRHDGNRPPSLFSDQIIEHIAEEAIALDPWPDTPEPPHPLFADRMKISFSLTNLNGIPVRSEGQIIRQPGTGGAPATGKNSVFSDAVQTTFHHDAIRFELCRQPRSGDRAADGFRLLQPWKTQHEKISWELFRKAAIASGAFPAAFPPARLLRNKREYGKLWPRELEQELKAEDFLYDYLDGGITRNEPLREAVHMAAISDAGEDVERVFILIDPNISRTSELYPLSYNQLLMLKEEFDKGGNMKSMQLVKPDYIGRIGGVMGRFASVLASQATFRDWLKAAHYNSQIEWKEELMEILDDLNPVPESALAERVDSLLIKIYREKLYRAMDGELTEESERKISDQISRDVKERSVTRGEDDFNAKIKLLVELVANLRGKRKLNMVAITPASIEGGGEYPIAGNFLRNFGGFLKEEYRDHDFRAGKHIAANVLTAPVPDAQRFLKDGSDVPAAPDPILPEPAYKNVEDAQKHRLETFIGNFVDEAIPKISFWLNLAGFIPMPLRTLRRIVRNKIVESITRSLMSETGGKAHFIQLRFENVNGDWHLKANRGNDGEPENRMIETVIGIRKYLEGGIRYEIFGPHVHMAMNRNENGNGNGNGEDKTYTFKFYRGYRRPWKKDEHKLSIALEGDPSEWYSRACFSSSPGLVHDLGQAHPAAPLLPAQVFADPVSRIPHVSGDHT